MHTNPQNSVLWQTADSCLVPNLEKISLAIYENYLILSHDFKNQADSHAQMYLLAQFNYKRLHPCLSSKEFYQG